MLSRGNIRLSVFSFFHLDMPVCLVFFWSISEQKIYHLHISISICYNKFLIWNNKLLIWNNKSLIWDNKFLIWYKKFLIWNNKSLIWDNKLLIWDNKLLIWDNKLLWNNKLSICWKWYWCDPNSAFDIPQKIHIHVHTGAVQEFFSEGWEGGGGWGE